MSPFHDSRRPWFTLAFVAVILAAAIALRISLFPLLGTRFPYVTFFPAVMFSALLAGVYAGIFATFVSVFFASYFLIEPVGRLAVRDTGDWIGSATFVLSCLMASLLCEFMRRAQRRASEAETQVKLAAERERATDALQRSEVRFQSCLENCPVAVFVVDREGQFLHVNAAAADLLGYPVATLRRMHLLEVQSIEEHQAALRQLALLFEQGQLAADTSMVRKDGGTVWVSLRACRVDPDHAIVYCQDISDLAQLLQRNKLEAIARLAGGVAHQLNNNLAVIMGYSALARMERLDGATFHDYLDRIDKAAEQSRDVTRQLLSFSRNDVASPQPVELNRLLKGSDMELWRMLPPAVELRFALAEGLWPVFIDPSQVTQIVMSLAANACEAMPEGGVLSIQTGNVGKKELRAVAGSDATPGDYVRLSVADTGVGMDAKLLERIFDPFFTTKDVGKGVGLGLPAVYGIVSQNGGLVNVRSTPGAGTVVSLYLPRLESEREEEPQTRNGADAAAGRVLLVEDEETVRHMAQLMLEKIGYSVVAAGSPPEALELCRSCKEEIHCLLTDVIMPEIDGVQLSAQVRGICPGIGIVYMSGYSAEMIPGNKTLDPGVSFLQKPFDIGTLNEKIQQAVTFSRSS